MGQYITGDEYLVLGVRKASSNALADDVVSEPFYLVNFTHNT